MFLKSYPKRMESTTLVEQEKLLKFMSGFQDEMMSFWWLGYSFL